MSNYENSTMFSITIADRVFKKARSLIIAEVAQAHDGSLGIAHSYIDAIAKAGANAVKFQTHIAEAESTSHEPWRVKFSEQDETRYDYWKRMEFTEEQWASLKKHADDQGLIFLSSPFSSEAVELLKKIGVPAWKVASGEINNYPLLNQMAATGLPILLSSGMSPLEEIDTAVKHLQKFECTLAVLQCTSQYPCPPEKIGLNLIPFFRNRYECAVGLSDHSGTIFAALAAATLGVEILEIHVTFSNDMFGPDVPASITIAQLEELVQGVRFIERAQSSLVTKDELADEAAPLRALFTKSIVLQRDLAAGTILSEEHFLFKKPGTGIPVNRLDEVIGHRLKHPKCADELLSFEDLE